jgi:hypothetical protein
MEKKSLRRPKHSTTEVAEPEEEKILYRCGRKPHQTTWQAAGLAPVRHMVTKPSIKSSSIPGIWSSCSSHITKNCWKSFGEKRRSKETSSKLVKWLKSENLGTHGQQTYLISILPPPPPPVKSSKAANKTRKCIDVLFFAQK